MRLSKQLLLTLNLINDNRPIFVGTTKTIDLNTYEFVDERKHSKQHQSLPLFRIQLPENRPIYSKIYQIKATDADSGNNARLTYSLESNRRRSSRNVDEVTDSSLPFEISPNNGAIILRDALDRETEDFYELVITVTDHGLPLSFNATAIVHVYVDDINDNRPQWIQSKYFFDIAEDAPIGSLLGSVKAFDVDLDGNSSLIYNLTDSSTFNINPSTGQIFLQNQLDRENLDRYEFLVDVFDQGLPGSLSSDEKALIIVNVLDVNDNRPKFIDTEERDRLTVPIGTTRKTIIATFHAIDADAGTNGTVYYGLVEENDLFKIDSTSGSLMTKIDIKDSLKRAIQKLLLIATDGQGKRSEIKTIEIEIVDKRNLAIDLDDRY
ncbi:Cadherin-like protein 2, partial [Sarcoptes scabiei]